MWSCGLLMKKKLYQIEDVQQLREVTRLLENENDQLHKQLQKLSREVDDLKGTDAKTLQLEINRLKSALDGERTKHSKKKSERRRPHRRVLKKSPDEREPETGGGRTEQKELECVTQRFVLTDDEKMCSCCGRLAEVMEGALETSEVIDLVKREFKVVKVEREKAAHRCSCAPKKIVTAPGPQKMVAKGRFSLDFGLLVTVAKYYDHMPLELQSTQMLREGLEVRPNVLWNQIEHQAVHWGSTVQAIRHEALETSCVQTDDTGYPMLELGRKLWHAFVLSTPKVTYIEIAPGKDHKRVMELLTHPKLGPYQGFLMCDGASTFTRAQQEMGTFVVANDWSHARRKFVEAAPDYPVANEVLDLIAKLFEIEREATQIPDMTLHDARRKLRREKSKPVTDAIKKWLTETTASWGGADLNKAILYTDKRWKKLTLFLEHPEIPLHNNASEFALRKPVRGRKNFHGVKSPDGAKIASMAYTLCETARKNGILPSDYLREVFLRDRANPGTATLPWDL